MRRGDLNPHGNNPASTSIQNVLAAQPAGHPEHVAELPRVGPEALLAVEAQALLDAAAGQEPVELERLQVFARACLEMSETGRLALAVLDGGLFASRRALELAVRVRDLAPSDDGVAGAVRKTGA